MTSRIKKIVGRSQRATFVLIISIATVLIIGSISLRRLPSKRSTILNSTRSRKLVPQRLSLSQTTL